MNVPDSAKSNLTIVLVTGSHTLPAFWGAIVPLLNAKDYFSVAVPFLSVCPADNQRWPPATLQDDALYIREVLQALLAKGRDIIMVMASYGGLPGTEALAQLPSRDKLRSEPLQAGQQGAIVGLIYLSAVMPFVGDSCVSALEQPWIEPGTYGVIPDVENIGPGLFPEWDPVEHSDEMKFWCRQILTMSADALVGQVTHDIWAQDAFNGKVVAIVGAKDQSVKPAYTERTVEKANSMWKGGTIATKQFDGGHVMMITRPNEMVGVIEEMVTSLI